MKFKGTDYKTGMFLTITQADIVKRYELIEFCLEDSKRVLVVCNQWKVGELNKHLLAYEAITKLIVVYILDIKEFDGPPISIHAAYEKWFFRKKTSFSKCRW